MTAVFADIVDSTSLGERLDPEVLRLVLSRYFEEMSAAIEKWGGSVAKYVGDAVLGVFGLPRSHGDDADRALFAVLDMDSRLMRLNESLEKDHGVRLQSRSGVETGEVVAAGVDEVVLGDVMNTAARLEQAAEPDTALVGSRTVELLTRSFDLEEVTPVEAKGKAEPVSAYRLLGGSSESPSLAIELVGRSSELRFLSRHLATVRSERRPHVVTVVGEAGIGKSALVGAFLDDAARTGASTLSAACLPYGEGIASWPMRQILDQLSDLEIGDGRIEEGIERIVSGMAQAGRVADALAVSAGTVVGDSPLDRLPLEAIQRELTRAWSLTLSKYAQSVPLVVVFEDLHWADPELVALIEGVADGGDGPILIVGTARPGSDIERGLESTESGAHLDLEPLADDDLSGLAERLLPGMPWSQAQTVLAPAGGNPLFMEEIVAHLVHTGVVQVSEGRYQLGDETRTGSVPDTIRSLLSARIDGLSRESKAALLAASVFGITFYPALLATMIESLELEPIVEDLVKTGLIAPAHRDGLARNAYDFRHNLVREVAYAALPRARAARFHLIAAQSLEAQIDEGQDAYADAIAHHLASAAEGRLLAWPSDHEMAEEIRSRAVIALLRAGSLLLRRTQWSDSLRLIERAGALASAGEEANQVALAMARAFRAGDHFDDACRAYRDLIEECSVGSAGDIRSDAVIEGVVMVGQMGGGISDDLGWKDWLVGVVDAEGDRARSSGSLEELAALRMAQGSQHAWGIGTVTADEGHDAALEAFRLADEVDSIRVKAPAMDLLAGFTLIGKGLGPAARLIDQLIAVAEEAPDRVVANELYTTAQWLLVASGDLEHAAEVGTKHLDEARLLGTHSQIHAHRGVVEVSLGRGDVMAVIPATDDLLDLVAVDGGKVCEHGGVAVTGRALAQSEKGMAEGQELFERFAEMANPSALFAAQFGNLERWRPFLTVDRAEKELVDLGEPSTVYQQVARSWVALPLAVAARRGEWLEQEIHLARGLAASTDDPSLEVLADWGDATAHLINGDQAAELAVHDAIEQLLSGGRTYTAWRLAADAAGLMHPRPTWIDHLAAAAEAGGALRTASQLRE